MQHMKPFLFEQIKMVRALSDKCISWDWQSMKQAPAGPPGRPRATPSHFKMSRTALQIQCFERRDIPLPKSL